MQCLCLLFRLNDSRGDDVHSEGQTQWDLHGLWGLLYYRQHGVCPTSRHEPALHSLLHCHPRPIEVCC